MPKARPIKLPELSSLGQKDLKGKRVLLRLDLNAPVERGKVQNDFRIVQSLPTLKWLMKQGSRVVILSHLGEKGESLKPVAVRLNKYLPVGFAPTLAARDLVANLGEGRALLLENVRRERGEEANSQILAKKLAKLGDLYVNDAFAVAHRSHASVVGIPKYLPSYAGFLLANEIANLEKVFTPRHPFIFILGGAKFSTKVPLLKKFIKIADQIFVGGALANDFYKMMGLEVGQSLMDKDYFLVKPFLGSKKISVPMVVVTSRDETKLADAVTNKEAILDAGVEWIEEIKPVLKKAKFILWNGPLGNFEKGFGAATKALAKAIAGSKAHSVVGGGDTIAAIEELGLMNKFSFVSTGGGAMLEFLAKGTLPGIEALRK